MDGFECSTCEYLKHDNSYFKRIDIQFLMEILSIQIVVSIRLILIWNKIYSTLAYAYLLIISIQIRYANISCHCESNYIKLKFFLVSSRNQKGSKNETSSLKFSWMYVIKKKRKRKYKIVL